MHHVNRKIFTRTSKMPGRTRAINIFTLANGKFIVDLPGYGFARFTPESKKLWQEMIEGYISSRKTLKTVYIYLLILMWDRPTLIS